VKAVKQTITTGFWQRFGTTACATMSRVPEHHMPILTQTCFIVMSYNIRPLVTACPSGARGIATSR